MGISGNLSTMSLPDILQWLSMGFKTGILEFTHKETSKKIFFNDGTIVSTKSKDRKDSLGQILLRNKKITAAQIESFLEMQKQSGTLFGKLLLSEGVITAEELDYYLRLQSEEIVFSLFRWKDADFEFTECDLPEDEIIPISLKVVSLIMEGTKRKDDWSRIVKELPSPNIILDFTSEGRFSLLTRDLDATQKSITDEIDGSKSIAELNLHSAYSDFETYTFLYTLMKEDILEVRGVKDEVAEQREKVEREIIKINDLIEMRSFIKAKEEVDKLIIQYPEIHELSDLSKQIESEIEQEVNRCIPNEEIIPKASLNKDLSELTRLNITAEEGFLLSRIDGQMSIKEIRSISGFPKKDIHYAFYRLAILKVIDLGIDLSEAGTSETTDPEFSGTGSYMTADFMLDQNGEQDDKASAKTDFDEQTLEMIEAKYKLCVLGNYYEILEVPQDAIAATIKDSFYTLSKKFHPDTYSSKVSPVQSEKVEKIFNQITKAFETLINMDDRLAYNKSLAGQQRGLPPPKSAAQNIEEAKNLFKKGQAYFRQKDYQRAYQYFTEAHDANPNNPVYLGMLAQIEYRHLHNLKAAENHCQKAITFTPDNPKLYIILGKILIEQQRLEEAKKAFEKTLSLDRNNQIAQAELRKIKK
ncbi:DUF4388 domain-containing protein [candidate division CSSED10-310 bacterium]|uniref:DUF4388 domain-containing protein n=1 Tax=candidate division CSSED10-310 bacterium TaxID=2855610 RepID=A0ABV6YVC0_UNCC1